MDYSIPEDKEITWAVLRILLNRSGGPSVMRAEHLRQWLIDETRDNSPDATNWMKVVAIIKAAFQDGTMAEEFTCKTFVLIPKRKGDFRGIGLIEVLWKEIASLLNRRITEAISFHDTLHGFGLVRGTGTAAREPNLLQ